MAFDNVNLKTWSRYLERPDEEFIERSGTWEDMLIRVWGAGIYISMILEDILWVKVWYLKRIMTIL